MLKLVFDIPVRAKSVQSARWTTTKTGKLYSYQPSSVIEYKRTIHGWVRSQLPKGFEILTNPLRVVLLRFTYKIPQSYPMHIRTTALERDLVYKSTGVDLADNLQKGFWDALQGLVFLDDKQIVELNKVQRVWGVKDGIYLEIEELQEDEYL